MGRELIEMGYKPSSKEGERFNDIIALADDCRDLAGMNKDELIAILQDSNGSVQVAVERLNQYLIKNSNPFQK